MNASEIATAAENAAKRTNAKLERIAAIIRELLELFPNQKSVDLYIGPGFKSITFHSVPSYEDGTELMRSLDIQVRNKQIVQSDSPFCNLNATVDGISINAYCHTLPPTCRLEKFIERIPKEQIIKSDSEFVEIERMKVVCGQEAEGAD